MSDKSEHPLQSVCQYRSSGPVLHDFITKHRIHCRAPITVPQMGSWSSVGPLVNPKSQGEDQRMPEEKDVVHEGPGLSVGLSF